MSLRVLTALLKLSESHTDKCAFRFMITKVITWYLRRNYSGGLGALFGDLALECVLNPMELNYIR